MVKLVENLKERSIIKNEKILFELIKATQVRSLNEKEQRKFIKSATNSVSYIEEEFITVRENGSNNSLDFVAVNNALTLISDLKEGIKITEKNFVKENVINFAIHYQSIKDYEEGFIEYRNNRSHTSFSKTIDLFMESKSFIDGYQKEKALTKR